MKTEKRSPMQPSYVDGLVTRIVDGLQMACVLSFNKQDQFIAERTIRQNVTDVMDEIQHRMYQDTIAPLQDLARNLHPETERK